MCPGGASRSARTAPRLKPRSFGSGVSAGRSLATGVATTRASVSGRACTRPASCLRLRAGARPPSVADRRRCTSPRRSLTGMSRTSRRRPSASAKRCASAPTTRPNSTGLRQISSRSCAVGKAQARTGVRAWTNSGFARSPNRTEILTSWPGPRTAVVASQPSSLREKQRTWPLLSR